MNRYQDWWAQAERDLAKAKQDREGGYYEWACFTAQQAGGKALKALGYKMGISLWGHSLSQMLSALASELPIPQEIKEKGKLLDFYYILPRDPNGFAAGTPADYFSHKEAQEALDAAVTILRFCKSHLS